MKKFRLREPFTWRNASSKVRQIHHLISFNSLDTQPEKYRQVQWRLFLLPLVILYKGAEISLQEDLVVCLNRFSTTCNMSEQFGPVKPQLEKEHTRFFTAHLSLPSSDAVK